MCYDGGIISLVVQNSDVQQTENLFTLGLMIAVDDLNTTIKKVNECGI